VALEVGVTVVDTTLLVIVTVEDAVAEEMRPGRVPTVVVATAVVSGAALDEASTVVVLTDVLAAAAEDDATEVVAGAAEDEEAS